MLGQVHGRLHAQGRFPRPTIAPLTPKTQDLGRAEVVVIQSLQLRIVTHPL